MKTSHLESLMTAELKVSMEPIAGHSPVVNKTYNVTKSQGECHEQLILELEARSHLTGITCVPVLCDGASSV